LRHFLRITEYEKEDIFRIFQLTDQIRSNKYKEMLKGKTIVLFFPSTSIRTRVTFEKGIHMLGGQSILFPSDTLNKKEEIKDVIGYLNNWADCVIIRHSDINLLNEAARYSKVPVINAMTDINHPCEIISDLYSISKLRENYLDLNYTFVGASGNIGKAWAEAAKVLSLKLQQCCPKGYEIEGIPVVYDIKQAMKNSDVVLTDSIPLDNLTDFKEFQVSKALMDMANKNAVLNPCPPFTRGEEVTAEVIDSKYFVGYVFKEALLCVQQAIILFCML
jgi:ornithine carbamoyltransferase